MNVAFYKSNQPLTTPVVETVKELAEVLDDIAPIYNSVPAKYFSIAGLVNEKGQPLISTHGSQNIVPSLHAAVFTTGDGKSNIIGLSHSLLGGSIERSANKDRLTVQQRMHI